MTTISTVSLLLLLNSGLSGAQEPSVLAAEAFAAEKALWQSEVDGDIDAFTAKLDDDFVQVTTSTGNDVSIITSRDSAVASLQMALQSMEFGDFELDLQNARELGDTVILTYLWRQLYQSRSDDTPLRVQGVATSIWVQDAATGWHNVYFHWHSQASN